MPGPLGSLHAALSITRFDVYSTMCEGGTAVLIVTHDLELAGCGGKVLKMARGWLEYSSDSR